MKRLMGLLLLALTGIGTASAQESYPVAAIPADLRARAKAVVRDVELKIDIRSDDDVTYRMKKTVTIFNSSGLREALIVLFYDKSREIKSVRGTLSDEFGTITARFTEKNFEDRSAVSDFSLYDDSRVKVFQANGANYPFTLSYEYEIRSKQTLLFPEWECAPSAGVSGQQASMLVSARPGITLRHKEYNFPGKVITAVTPDGSNTWLWKIGPQKALKEEPFSPDERFTDPSVEIAVEKFSYRGVGGSFKTWDEYGLWMSNKILAGRSAVSARTASEVKDLVAGTSDPKEKARLIYAYVQRKMRYISVQIGIGGYQPVSALETDQLSYGDCKALVNYTKSLLELAGIPAYYCVVEAGSFKRDPDPDFANMNFGNHVILCLPFKADTTWLECTSKSAPFGFLGDFTDDRVVVACTETGGKLMHTPSYPPEQNLQDRKGGFAVGLDGHLRGSMTSIFSGTQYESREAFITMNEKERLNKIGEVYPLNNLNVGKLEYIQEKEKLPVTKETLSFDASSYATISENRMYIPLNQLNAYGNAPREVSNRLNPLYINRGFMDTDEYSYTFPEGYKVENSPEAIKIERPFGSFRMSVETNGNKLVYKRYLRVNKGTYEAAEYTRFVDFLTEVNSADSRKVILLKN